MKRKRHVIGQKIILKKLYIKYIGLMCSAYSLSKDVNGTYISRYSSILKGSKPYMWIVRIWVRTFNNRIISEFEYSKLDLCYVYGIYINIWHDQYPVPRSEKKSSYPSSKISVLHTPSFDESINLIWSDILKNIILIFMIPYNYR
jgi:hypothetical protein